MGFGTSLIGQKAQTGRRGTMPLTLFGRGEGDFFGIRGR
jgi:hypothetical protein